MVFCTVGEVLLLAVMLTPVWCAIVCSLICSTTLLISGDGLSVWLCVYMKPAKHNLCKSINSKAVIQGDELHGRLLVRNSKVKSPFRRDDILLLTGQQE